MEAQLTKLSRQTLKANSEALRLERKAKLMRGAATARLIVDTRPTASDIQEMRAGHEWLDPERIKIERDKLSVELFDAMDAAGFGLLPHKTVILACLILGDEWQNRLWHYEYVYNTRAYVNRIARENGFSFRVTRRRY